MAVVASGDREKQVGEWGHPGGGSLSANSHSDLDEVWKLESGGSV